MDAVAARLMRGGVLHIDTGAAWRGGQQQAYLLHREMYRRGGEGSLMLAREGGELLERCRREGLPSRALTGRFALQPAVLRALLDSVRGARVVHAHDSHAAVLCAILRRFRPGLRFVCHRRVSYPLGRNPLSRLKYRQVDAWIAVSGEIAASLHQIGVDPRRVSVVHSSLDVEAFRLQAAQCEPERLREELGISAGDIVVGLCGAFSPQKGHRVLVEAARLLTREDVVYVLAGEGELRGEIEAAVVAAGLSERFRFLGFRQDVARVTELFAIAVVPSIDGEGSSAAIKEPMALGVPVIVSDLVGNREVVGSGNETAALVVPRGDAGGLTEALRRLLDDAALRRRLGQAGRERAERFAPASMVAATLDVYRGLSK